MTANPPILDPPSRRRRWVGPAILAALAYLPAIASSPGRMPADTKLYLYLDPGRLLGRATSTFEVEQFAGWVPHQQIAYLWPAGPWYWVFDTIGVPDWIAHRLWIATIMFVAGTGVRWSAKRLGLSEGGALAAALLYQLSPFILAYISRTSLLLLPWAALGWIVGLTIRAGAASAMALAPEWRDRLARWRDPALIALIVATIGAVNATAVALIIPAPLLWLVHAAWQRSLTWRQATTAALRIGVLSFFVSLWWIGMLVVQARYGAPVLAFSETLEDVSRNSTGSEVLRSLGYWLFYQRDPVGPTTTASLPYLISVRTIALSFLVVLIGLAGLAVVSWSQRRYAAMLVLVGMVLAVGVHPIDAPSPLMALLTDDGSGLALALRSSTRAVPVLLFGLALGAGAAVSVLPTRWPGRRRTALTPVRVGAVAVGLLAIINLPVLTGRDLVDPAIDRDEQPPAVWDEAAAAIDASADGGRVLQLPGAEFGSFRWGHTNDQPLVGLGSTPLVTRDLLPLGSAPAMDLLYALDDRFQTGVVDPASVAPVARLLGSTTILLTNDMAFERYRTARPEIVDALLTADVEGLGNVQRLGDPAINVAEVAMTDPTSLTDTRVGQPINPLTLIDVDDAQPVIRAKTETVVLSGSGDGVVDAAASGLLDGTEAIRYSASLSGDELRRAIDDANLLIVTDSNRDRAHHWRGSQDVHGHTESGGPGTDVLVDTNADQRLQMFATDDPDTQTVALQTGPVRAIASSYGEPFAYRPESRAVMAIDDDPDTAWSVGDHGDPVGERIRLTIADPDQAAADAGETVTLTQLPAGPGGRVITSVRLTIDDDRSIDVDLGPESTTAPGQAVTDPALGDITTLDVEITGVSDGDPAVASSRSGVGFSTIDLGRSPTTEIIRVPIDATTDGPLAMVLTRLRVDPTDPWRSDPEPSLSRSFSLASPRAFDADVTLRLDARASDQLVAGLLADATASPAAIANRRLPGAVAARGAAAVDGDTTTSWITPFDAAVGSTLTFDTSTAIETIDLIQPRGSFSPITAITLSDGAVSVDLDVPAPDADGRSRIAVAASLMAGPTTLTISEIVPVTTIDRRYGDVLTLPAAIATLESTAIEVTSVDPTAPVSAECIEGLLSIDSAPVGLSFSTTAGSLLDGDPIEATICGGPINLETGDHLIASGSGGPLDVDRIVLTDGLIDGADGTATAPVGVTVERNDARARTVTVDGCPSGCWLVLGEGFNDAWSATSTSGAEAGVDLGPPTLIDGGFNGWYLPASTTPTTVELRWTAQGPVTWGLTIGALTAVLLLAIVLTARRIPAPTLPAPMWAHARRTRRRALIGGAVLVVLAALLIAPIWGLIALVPTGVAVALNGRRPNRLLELVGLCCCGAIAIAVVAIERSERPFPNAGWTLEFDQLNGLAIFGVLTLAVGAMFGADGDRETESAADATPGDLR